MMVDDEVDIVRNIDLGGEKNLRKGWDEIPETNVNGQTEFEGSVEETMTIHQREFPEMRS